MGVSFQRIASLLPQRCATCQPRVKRSPQRGRSATLGYIIKCHGEAPKGRYNFIVARGALREGIPAGKRNEMGISFQRPG